MRTVNELPLEISCHHVRAKLAAGEDFLLLDCREADEFAVASLTSATLLPLSELQNLVAELDGWSRDRPIVTYCHHGMRSGQLATWLRQQGFSHVQSMAGGIDQWAVQIDPAMPRY